MKKIVWLIVSMVVLVFLIGLLRYGPADGVKLNLSAAAVALLNRTASDEIPKNITVHNIEIEPARWDSLVSQLPESRELKVKAKYIRNGIKYPVRIKIRGNLALHWASPKKSIRLYFSGKSPFGNIKQVNFVNPKTYHIINNNISMWLGNQVGMNTVYDKLVFLVINGEKYGLMEMMEQPNGRYERARNLSDSKVPVYKGDYIPEGDTVILSENVWESHLNWVYKGDVENSESLEVLEKLVNVINSDTVLENNYGKLEEYIDIDEFIRYYAGLRILNTVHIDQTHNQVIVYNSRKGKFYPVLWDPTMMWPAQRDNNFYMIYDALAYLVLSNPKWREQRDQIIYEICKEFHSSGRLYDKMDKEVAVIREAVYLDHNKSNPITNNLDDVFRFSNGHFEWSYWKLKKACKVHFEELLNDIQFNRVKVVEEENSLHIKYTTNVPLEVRLEFDGEKEDSVKVDFSDPMIQIVKQDKSEIILKLFGMIEHIDGVNANRYSVSRCYLKKEHSLALNLNQSVHKVTIYNAITGQEIKQE